MLLRWERRADLRGEYGSHESEKPCFGVLGVWISGVVEWVGVVTDKVSILTELKSRNSVGTKGRRENLDGLTVSRPEQVEKKAFSSISKHTHALLAPGALLFVLRSMAQSHSM